jgi:hypothetical protein
MPESTLLKGDAVNKQPKQSKQNFLSNLTRAYSGPLTGVALSAMSAWMIVTGLKGLAGFTVNQQTALADLVGIIIVIGVLRALKIRRDAK